MLLLASLIYLNLLLVVCCQPEVWAQPTRNNKTPQNSADEQLRSDNNDDDDDNSINHHDDTITLVYTPTQPTTSPPPLPPTQHTATLTKTPKTSPLMNHDDRHHYDDTQLAANAVTQRNQKPPNYHQTFKMRPPVPSAPPSPPFRQRGKSFNHPNQNDQSNDRQLNIIGDNNNNNDDNELNSPDDVDAQLDNPLSRFYITKYLFLEFRAKNWSDRPLGELTTGIAGTSGVDPMHPMIVPAPPTHMVPPGHAPLGNQSMATLQQQQPPFLFGVATAANGTTQIVPLTMATNGMSGGLALPNGEMVANFVVNILPRPYFGDFFTSFQQSFTSIQVTLSLIFCVIGIFANLTNVVVLTRPNMITAVNTILCAIACSDFIVNISNIPYLIHALYDQDTFGYFSYEWAVYTLMHAHVTVTAHTISIWLTCALATWRYFVVSSKSANQRNWSVSLALRVIVIVVILVPIICIPSYLSFMITSELRQQGDIMFSVGFTALAESSQFFRTFHFWMFSSLTKLLPCVLLTFFTTVLVRKLLSARERRLRLTGGNQLGGKSHAPTAATLSHNSSGGARTKTITTTTTATTSTPIATNAAHALEQNAHDHKSIPNGRPVASQPSRLLTSNSGGDDDDGDRNKMTNGNHEQCTLVLANGLGSPPQTLAYSQEPITQTGSLPVAPADNGGGGGGKHLELLARRDSIRNSRKRRQSQERNFNSKNKNDDDDDDDDDDDGDDDDRRRTALLSSSRRTSSAENQYQHQQATASSSTVSATSSSTTTTAACLSQPTSRCVSVLPPPPQLITIPSDNSEQQSNNNTQLKGAPENLRSASTCGALELYATIGDNQRTTLSTSGGGREPIVVSTVTSTQSGAQPKLAPADQYQPLTRTNFAISSQDFTIQNKQLDSSSSSTKRGFAPSLSHSNLRVGGANGATTSGRNSIDPQITSPNGGGGANNRIQSVGSASFAPFHLVKVQATQRQLSQNETTTRLLIAVMVLFLICEFPAGLLAALCAVLGQEFFDNVYQPMGGITDLFALINSSINFVLYCFMSTQFRVTFYRVVLRCPAPNLPRTNN